MNRTMEKFGAPASVIHEYRHWSILLRPAQLTLGALVMIAHDPVTAFSDLSADSIAEMHTVIDDIERVLGNRFAYDKINYLMLMMVDPDVHFHVVPRYREGQSFADMTFTDPGWPGPPDLAHDNAVSEDVRQKLVEDLQRHWRPAG